MLNKVTQQLKNKNSEFNLLGDILETLRFKGNIFFQSKLAAPWGMSMGQSINPRFHISLNGDFFIGVNQDEKNAHKISHMDIVILPSGAEHWIADQQGSKLTSSESAGKACELGSPLFQKGEITNKVICGIVKFDKEIAHPVLNSLPSILHFSKLEFDDPIWMIVMVIEAEMKASKTHLTPIIDRLSEVLFLQLIQRHIKSHPEEIGFLGALSDPKIRRSLELIHQSPEYEWTLDELSQQVAMSRATFSRQFKHFVGDSPIVYLTKWRMIKAYDLLKHSNQSLEQISELVGFTSSKTLAKAFQKHFGASPKEFRGSNQ